MITLLFLGRPLRCVCMLGIVILNKGNINRLTVFISVTFHLNVQMMLIDLFN